MTKGGEVPQKGRGHINVKQSWNWRLRRVKIKRDVHRHTKSL